MDARRRQALAAASLALGLAATGGPGTARAEDLRGGVPGGLTIHGPEETLHDLCVRDAEGVLWFCLPGGARFELVESIDDPAIANQGDGAFHTFEVAEVQAALSQVRYPLQSVRADVYLLPFPRRGGLESAAGPALVMLSPGVRPLSVQQQHAETVHEMGHVLQYALLPDADAARWARYRRMRDIEDEAIYAASGVHANRPHEIFAEDFRALFGGAAANYSGTIENAQLAPPQTVPGLADFFLDLAAARLMGVALRAAVNPTRAFARFESNTFDGPLDIVDVAGRRLATVQPVRVPGGVEWTWDRRDANGVRVGPGVIFARARDDRRTVARLVLAP